MLYENSLREAYSWVKFIEKTIREDGFRHPELAKERLIEIKRDIRKQVNRKETGWFEEIGENYIGGWSKDEDYHAKYFFPDEHWTKEDEREFRKAFWIECQMSPYDCTGAVFTSAIDICDTPKGMLVYIWMSRDV